MKQILLMMSLMLSITLLSCSDDDDFVELMDQEVKTDDRSDDNRACDNPKVSDEYQNARAYGECLSGVARR